MTHSFQKVQNQLSAIVSSEINYAREKKSKSVPFARNILCATFNNALSA